MGYRLSTFLGGSDRSLRTQALAASFWILAENATNFAFRLASSIIVTRLLFPGAYGLMALVYVISYGLVMLSDVGLRASIIQHHRGEDPEFLRVVWTAQVIRGLWLWLAACLITPVAAAFFGEPALRQLLPVAALASLIRGFLSVNRHLASRRMAFASITCQSIFASLVRLVTTILCAIWLRSAWALVAGEISGALTETILSHILLPGPRMRLAWQADVMTQLMQFGRWILVSTALQFLATQGDRLLLGRFLPAEVLGIYAVATTLAGIVVGLNQQLSNQVLFPLFTRLLRDKSRDARPAITRARLALLAIGLPVLCVFATFGKYIVELIYDPRYHDAGWMLEVLAIGAIAQTISASASQTLLAVGDSYRLMWIRIFTATVTPTAMIIGHSLAGTSGLIAGVAFAKFLEYPVFALMAFHYRTVSIALDFLILATTLSTIGAVKLMLP